MSQFGIDITFQFDPASTIPALSISLPLPPSFRALSPPFRAPRNSLLLVTPINGQGRAASWTPMISRLSRRDADIEIARWCNCVKRRGKGEEMERTWPKLSPISIYYLWNINGIPTLERSFRMSYPSFHFVPTLPRTIFITHPFHAFRNFFFEFCSHPSNRFSFFF